MVQHEKPKKTGPRPERLLTEVELELMNLIWDRAPCTVREIVDVLPKDRDLAYTSVATVMKILEQKGFITSTKEDRTLTFEVRVPRTEYEAMSLRHLASNVFRGDSTSLVMRLLDDSDLSERELSSIRKILEGKRKA